MGETGVRCWLAFGDEQAGYPLLPGLMVQGIGQPSECFYLITDHDCRHLPDQQVVDLAVADEQHDIERPIVWRVVATDHATHDRQGVVVFGLDHFGFHHPHTAVVGDLGDDVALRDIVDFVWLPVEALRAVARIELLVDQSLCDDLPASKIALFLRDGGLELTIEGDEVLAVGEVDLHYSLLVASGDFWGWCGKYAGPKAYTRH